MVDARDFRENVEYTTRDHCVWGSSLEKRHSSPQLSSHPKADLDESRTCVPIDTIPRARRYITNNFVNHLIKVTQPNWVEERG